MRALRCCVRACTLERMTHLILMRLSPTGKARVEGRVEREVVVVMVVMVAEMEAAEEM